VTSGITRPPTPPRDMSRPLERALQNGWNKETIGHHIVRDNTISHCEQAASLQLGSHFSVITGNHYP